MSIKKTISDLLTGREIKLTPEKRKKYTLATKIGVIATVILFLIMIIFHLGIISAISDEDLMAFKWDLCESKNKTGIDCDIYWETWKDIFGIDDDPETNITLKNYYNKSVIENAEQILAKDETDPKAPEAAIKAKKDQLKKNKDDYKKVQKDECIENYTQSLFATIIIDKIKAEEKIRLDKEFQELNKPKEKEEAPIPQSKKRQKPKRR